MTRPTAMAPDASTSPVDWSRPIEAVHEDGRVVPTQVTEGPDRDGDYWVADPTGKFPRSGMLCCRPDGRGDADGWRIRNVQPTTPELDPALWDRMEALVRQLARDPNETFMSLLVGMAKGIVADLPKPVDPDLIEARKLAASFSDREDVSHADYLSGDLDSGGEVQGFLAAIKRGRELAAPEVSHVG